MNTTIEQLAENIASTSAAQLVELTSILEQEYGIHLFLDFSRVPNVIEE